MGSVLDIIDCPNCGKEANTDYYYKTGEEYVFCTHCGYYRSSVIKEEARNKYVNELTEDDFEVKELKNPYGSFRITTYEGAGHICGSLESKTQLDVLKTECENDNEVQYLVVSRFVNNTIETEVVVDNGPKFDGAGFSKEDR